VPEDKNQSSKKFSFGKRLTLMPWGRRLLYLILNSTQVSPLRVLSRRCGDLSSQSCLKLWTNLIVLSKFATTRYNQPWITRQIKRFSRWKQRAHNIKVKKSGRECDWKRYKKLKKQCQNECRTAYSTYITEMIAPSMDSNPKKFWSFIKSKRNDKTGVAPIKDDNGFT